MRQRLVPVRGAAVVVAAVVRVAVLDANADGLVEDHRVAHVVAVHGDALVERAGVARLVVGHAIVGVCVLHLHSPCVRQVVLRAGSVHVWRPLLAVDHEHVVAFAPPASV